ncbi:MAG TPA: methionyl-tRNA formyltransferase [Pyrinomonadaceae bacterium]|jgi:methionyl-tRNA formyltransferase|nr:methionyl-tRNA formyltransferase [Pyrinomonadaceae bacterium]
MRIVFMGTPAAAVPSLQRCLADGHEVVAVWTQPDRPSGRGHKVTPSPVKVFALEHQLPIYQPNKIKTDEAKTLFAAHEADVAVVVAYGRILPAEFLSAPRLGCINVHFSLLPLYRGAAPVNWAIVNGETNTGVTTMFIAPELDSGPILLQERTEIGSAETAPELMARLAPMGANLLGETLSRLNEISPIPQDDALATFAPILKKEDGQIDWSRDAAEIERAVRGFQPWPNAYTHQESHRLIIWNAEVANSDVDVFYPGDVVAAHGDELIIQCGGVSQLLLTEVQPEGKRRMSARDYLNGGHLDLGDKLH